MNRLLWPVCLAVVLLLPACAGQVDTPPPAVTPSAFPTATPTMPPPTPTAPAAGRPADGVAGFVPGEASLDFAQVLFVVATRQESGLWRFDVTVRHNDEGWDHYANAWQVVDLQGNVLAERVLAHPHDTEQPFTRSHRGVRIPADVQRVLVRARCNVHGFGGQSVLVDLGQNSGEGFEVRR
ncbi:MAG: hypothetical protein D6784_13715 [Chloroflexi bacterium]|nr:MAG: hypothetical protein D6784_13715 [Chloroflexota bacterium]